MPKLMNTEYTSKGGVNFIICCNLKQYVFISALFTLSQIPMMMISMINATINIQRVINDRKNMAKKLNS